jgi:hypothetical protein
MLLTERLENVKDSDSFLLFVSALIEDRKKNEEEISGKKSLNIHSPVSNNNEWQNNSIGDYLEAASEWAKAFMRQGNLPEHPTWKTFAEFLYAGKIYE